MVSPTQFLLRQPLPSLLPYASTELYRQQRKPGDVEGADQRRGWDSVFSWHADFPPHLLSTYYIASDSARCFSHVQISNYEHRKATVSPCIEGLVHRKCYLHFSDVALPHALSELRLAALVTQQSCKNSLLGERQWCSLQGIAQPLPTACQQYPSS